MYLGTTFEVWSESLSDLEISEQLPSFRMETIQSRSCRKIPGRVPSTLQFDLTKGEIKMRVQKGRKKVTLFQYLLTKMFFDEEDGISSDEYVALWILYDYLLDIKDPVQKQSLSNILASAKVLLDKVSRQTSFPCKFSLGPESLQYQSNRIPCLLHPNSYFGMKKQGRLAQFQIFQKQAPKSTYNKSFVGVGYSDQGTRRDPAKDGSPKWQEVATSENFRHETDQTTTLFEDLSTFDQPLLEEETNR